VEPADELDAAAHGRHDAAANAEQPRGDFHCGAEVAHPLRERGEDHVPDRVTAEAAVSGETMLEHVGERVLASSERHEAVADVAGARQAVAAAEPAGASAVVAGGHDAADVDAPLRIAIEERERSQGGRQAGPTAHGDDAQRPGARRRNRPENAPHVVDPSARCGHRAPHCNASEYEPLFGKYR
jgi:hypothetical protein